MKGRPGPRAEGKHHTFNPGPPRDLGYSIANNSDRSLNIKLFLQAIHSHGPRLTARGVAVAGFVVSGDRNFAGILIRRDVTTQLST